MHIRLFASNWTRSLWNSPKRTLHSGPVGLEKHKMHSSLYEYLIDENRRPYTWSFLPMFLFKKPGCYLTTSIYAFWRIQKNCAFGILITAMKSKIGLINFWSILKSLSSADVDSGEPLLSWGLSPHVDKTVSPFCALQINETAADLTRPYSFAIYGRQ